MKELHKLPDYSIETLQSLIDNKIEESINIDFKSGEALSKIPSKKKELAKDISAMANANGGIIIYGIEEVNHVAHSFRFVNGNEFTKESLEQIISSTIKRMVPDIKIYPLRVDGDITKTIYVIQIPESIDAPHINNLDKRYYIRRNFESVQMEEYEVRQLYGRKVVGKISVNHIEIQPIPDKQDLTIKFQITVLAFNEGEILVKDYGLNLYMNRKYGSDVNYKAIGQGAFYNSVTMANHFKITNEKPPKLFPSDTLPIISFQTDFFDLEQVIDFLENNNIKALVMHDKHRHDLEYNNSKILKDFYNKEGVFSFLKEWIGDND